jgi:hypothetical protein
MTMRLFVNGSLVATTAATGAIDQSTQPLRIGSVEASGDFFPGIIDEVRVSNLVRYTTSFTPSSGPFVTDSNTVGLWHLDEGSGATTADASGHANTGTLIGNAKWSTDSLFTNPPPAITRVVATNIADTAATVSWTTDRPASSQVFYGTSATYGSSTTLDNTLITNHSQAISGLTPGTTYHVQVRSADASGNASASSDYTFATTGAISAPNISGVAVSNLTATSASITWSTDIPSDSQVSYGLTSAYGSNTAVDATLVTAHGQALSGLTPSTTYHFQVASRAQGGGRSVSGDTVFTTAAPTAALVGQWSPLMSWPIVAVNMTLLQTGQVLLWHVWEYNQTPSARLWDPGSQTFVGVPNLAAAMFCAATAALPDGRIVVVGGHNGDDTGINTASIFDPIRSTWAPLPNMHSARWYPGAATLPDGRVIVLGGEVTPGVDTLTQEIYDPVSNSWNMSGTLMPASVLTNDEQYPHSVVLPDGRLFVTSGTDLQSRVLNLTNQAWTSIGVSPAASGSAIQYRPGKILATGGGTGNANPVVATTAVIDMNQPNPAWRTTAPMAFPRYWHNLVALPDGKVLAVGGGDMYTYAATTGPLAAELWDPGTETWSTVAAMSERRMYHSSALLLPMEECLLPAAKATWTTLRPRFTRRPICSTGRGLRSETLPRAPHMEPV